MFLVNKTSSKSSNRQIEIAGHKFLNALNDTDLRDIQCKDDWKMAGCRRATCECDRGLAIRLREAKVSKIVWGIKYWKHE